MKIHAYCIAHYGKDYIGYALRSIFPFVDIAHVFYTSHPSHGHQVQERPPELSIQLFEAAKQFDTDNKMRWYQSGNIFYEGQQRDMAVRHCQQSGADIVLVVDVDEIWPADVLEQALQLVINGNANKWLINFTHLWRSFNWCCRDNAWPVRFIDLRPGDKQDTAYISKELGDIYHFGYAVTDKIMAYKWQIHGHKDELRNGWLDEKWYQWQPGIEDVHPTNSDNWWKPESFDKMQLPEFMREHPFWGVEMIR